MISGGYCGGLIILLHFVDGNSVPNGILSGWDQVLVGSGKPTKNMYFALYGGYLEKRIYVEHEERRVAMV